MLAGFRDEDDVGTRRYTDIENDAFAAIPQICTNSDMGDRWSNQVWDGDLHG